MDLCVLGSGSAGNCSVLRLDGHALLIDAGFGPRTTAKRLEGTGIKLADLRAVILTHLDHDHFTPNWFATLRRLNIRLYVHRKHLAELYAHLPMGVEGVDARQLHRAGLLEVFENDAFALPLGERRIVVHPVPFHHDRAGTIGFRLESTEARIGYATDLGRITAGLLDRFTDVDLLALESNYDKQLQVDSPRPWFLKNRIMGGSGHLSNHECFEAVCELLKRSRRPPKHVVLLHLSRECNEPDLVRRLYADHPVLCECLCLSSQHEPTPWLSARSGPYVPMPGEQLTMFS